MSEYTHDYAAFDEYVLAAGFMVEDMRGRAHRVADAALRIAPYDPSDKDGDHYIDHFSVDAGVREGVSGRRAFGRVTNDHEAAVDIEYGTSSSRPQGGSSPRHRVLGRSLDAAGDSP